ncbi:MAG: Ig-like domain-containing protein, partial [Clostridiales bacterium]|nr:Ig-like domain-containing protein [Clostridiales bacterium]
MTKTMKRALTAFLAIVMVFSYWSVAWADTGDTSNYEIEVVDELEFEGRTYTNLGAHGKYNDPGNGSGTIYMDQCDWDINDLRNILKEESGLTGIFNDTGATPTLYAGTDTVLGLMQNAKDELYPRYCLNYLSILHVRAKNPSYGELSVMTSDPQVLNKRHVCMWEMSELSTATDKYILMYICPEADESSQIRVTQGNDSGEANITFVKGRKLTGFYISETAVYEQQGSSFVGYGKIGSDQGDVYYMDDNKAKLNYIPGDELHFVFTDMATAAGVTGDSVDYRLFRGNTEIPKGSGFTVSKDDTGSNLNAIVTISDSIAHQGDNFTLKICEKAPGGPDTKTGRDLSRPVANVTIICLASNPITKISFKKTQYELTTVKNKTLLLTDGELIVTPSSDYTDKVLFKSSDPTVASVDQLTGEVTAKKVGTTTITAYSKKNPNVKGTCKIVVSNELEQIHISSPDQIVQGHTETVVYTTVPTQAEGCNLQDITWTSSNPSVLKITGPDSTGKVTITAPSNVSLGSDKVETVILTATGKNGVTTDKTITVYENNPSTSIDFTVVNNGNGPDCLLKSPVETGTNTYSIYGGQAAKINATLNGAEGSTGSTDKIEWFVTVMGTDVVDEPLYPNGPTDQSACVSYLNYQFTQGKDNKELIVTFLEGKNRPVIITGKAVGTEAGDTDVHAVQTILFQVNARTNGITWNVVSGPNTDNVADGDELTIRYTLQPNSDKNLDKVYVVSSDKAVLEIISHSNSGRTGLIKIKAKETGDAAIKIYATYDTGVTTGIRPSYFDYCQEINITVKTNMSHVEITHGVDDKIFKNAFYDAIDILKELVVSYGGSVLNHGDDFYLDIKNNYDIGICTVKII